MTFLEPTRLWLLLVVPVLLAAYVVLQRRRGRYAVRFTNLSLLDTVAPRRISWRQHIAVGLALLTVAGAVVLFAKPSGLARVPRHTSVTVVLTVDVSLSMKATDVPPNRITAAKQTAEEFVSQLPRDYKVGLVSFARYADVVVAPTTDRERLSRAIDGLRLHEYTATGEGIFTALDVVKQSLAGTGGTAGRLPAMIVMISDGKRTVGRSQVLGAQAAKAQNVPIYTVALGTPNANVISHGQVIPVPVEIGQLREIARISGGKSYVAATPHDLIDAYKDVNGRLFYETERTDVTSRYVGWLVLLALLTAASGMSVAARWP